MTSISDHDKNVFKVSRNVSTLEKKPSVVERHLASILGEIASSSLLGGTMHTKGCPSRLPCRLLSDELQNNYRSPS